MALVSQASKASRMEAQQPPQATCHSTAPVKTLFLIPREISQAEICSHCPSLHHHMQHKRYSGLLPFQVLLGSCYVMTQLPQPLPVGLTALVPRLFWESITDTVSNKREQYHPSSSLITLITSQSNYSILVFEKCLTNTVRYFLKCLFLQVPQKWNFI